MTRDRPLVAPIDGVAWCVTHDSWWVEGDTTCHGAWCHDVLADDDDDDERGDCVEVPLYREAT